MAQSMSQAHSATSVALQETRQQHTAELERLTRAQDALVSAAAREASALECQHAQDRLAEMQVRLEASHSRIHELQHELQVCMRWERRLPVCSLYNAPLITMYSRGEQTFIICVVPFKPRPFRDLFLL